MPGCRPLAQPADLVFQFTQGQGEPWNRLCAIHLAVAERSHILMDQKRLGGAPITQSDVCRIVAVDHDGIADFVLRVHRCALVDRLTNRNFQPVSGSHVTFSPVIDRSIRRRAHTSTRTYTPRTRGT